MSNEEAELWKQEEGRCTFPKCDRPFYARGLCLGHYTQDLRGGPLKPLRGKPSAGRVTVRLSAAAMAVLGNNPSKAAQNVIEAWASTQRPA